MTGRSSQSPFTQWQISSYRASGRLVSARPTLALVSTRRAALEDVNVVSALGGERKSATEFLMAQAPPAIVQSSLSSFSSSKPRPSS
eukprot:COSAG06_NODE_434_length_15810_cov_9.319521_4_plen_87_part_00